MTGEQLPRRRVVIVGGGFAGLFAARALKGAEADVTLVDRAAHHLFQPLLYQVATGVLSEGQIAVPLRWIMRNHENIECLQAEVRAVDVPGRTIRAERPGGGRLDLPYDDLVVAAGVRQSYFGHDAFAEHAPGMKTLADAMDIRRKVFGAFELAQTAADPVERARWLTFAIVGAGPTGVELAGQIRELATLTLSKQFHRLDVSEARVLLFDGGDRPLASFGVGLSEKAAEALSALGVEQHMHSLVTEVDGRGLVVRRPDGTSARYEAGTVVWAAGVAAPPLARELALSTGAQTDGAGRVKVAPDLTVPGHPEISVVGDMMSLGRLPGVAEVAMQSGYYVGRRIRGDIEGKPVSRPFRYHDLGSACLAVDPPHLPEQLPQQARGRDDVGVHVQQGGTARARVHPSEGGYRARRVRDARRARRAGRAPRRQLISSSIRA
jgi:NADH dehydrogenase